ncbi:hypothetical protein J8Z24_18360 [Pseudoalteromonas sp. SCSIO 43201]|uniref:hypothetical protein n=1 Tax=Pseudoalteromonas sp. SCSIO 43201 TaxID=2822842 RepID=UPI002075CAB9|nr:hypothetical protein [Pseudoalteromonas sp. SCSIO 43201]USD30924.1 hypothetical protein J8Z24_18360 [Pseudoalteromonas sp. SCSIO 43201]
MSSKSFSISYDAESTKKHSINAEHLGESLINLSRAIKKADKALNGEESSVEVKVKAHKKSSFEVSYEVIQLLREAKDVLQILGIGGAAGAFVSGTVMELIKKYGSKKMVSVNKQHKGKSIISFDDGTKVECEREVETLLTDPEFRKNFEEVFYSPVQTQKDAKIHIKNESGDVIETITREDSESFKRINTRAVESKEETKVTHIRFVQVNFESGTKGWKMTLKDNDAPVPVKINDNRFINKIERSEQALVKNALFEVKLKVKINYNVGSSPRYTYTIEEVLKHIAAKENKLL